MIFMKEIAEMLEKGKIGIKNVDYFIHMVYPIIKDKKMLQKIFLDLAKSVRIIVEMLILYEYYYKRIPDAKFNLEVFKKIAKRFELSNSEIDLIEEILNKAQEVEKANFDFLKQNSYIIMKNNHFVSFNIDDVKRFSLVVKNLYSKIEERLRKDLLIKRYLA